MTLHLHNLFHLQFASPPALVPPFHTITAISQNGEVVRANWRYSSQPVLGISSSSPSPAAPGFSTTSPDILEERMLQTRASEFHIEAKYLCNQQTLYHSSRQPKQPVPILHISKSQPLQLPAMSGPDKSERCSEAVLEPCCAPPSPCGQILAIRSW